MGRLLTIWLLLAVFATLSAADQDVRLSYKTQPLYGWVGLRVRLAVESAEKYTPYAVNYSTRSWPLNETLSKRFGDGIILGGMGRPKELTSNLVEELPSALARAAKNLDTEGLKAHTARLLTQEFGVSGVRFSADEFVVEQPGLYLGHKSDDPKGLKEQSLESFVR